MDKKYMKVAIVGSGPAGLACAIQCERLGLTVDLFEGQSSTGWAWPSVILLLNIFVVSMGGDIREFLKNKLKLDLQPLQQINELILKSPNEQASIKGNLGYFYARGKSEVSLENQMRRSLIATPISYFRKADYKELAQKYDYVVVATGNEVAAKELGVWEDQGTVYIESALVEGEFNLTTQYIFFNTEYAGQGFGRLTPIDNYHAVVDLYGIGMDIFDMDKKFFQFIKAEGLSDLEIKFRMSLPPFSMGTVKKLQVDNILLAGRAAGLTERLTGTGCTSALISGFLAANAMLKGKDYGTLLKPLQDHIENISSLRKAYEKLDNSGLDKMVKLSNNLAYQYLMYESPISFVDLIGSVLKRVP